jgi:hypothetical protein
MRMAVPRMPRRGSEAALPAVPGHAGQGPWPDGLVAGPMWTGSSLRARPK